MLYRILSAKNSIRFALVVEWKTREAQNFLSKDVWVRIPPKALRVVADQLAHCYSHYTLEQNMNRHTELMFDRFYDAFLRNACHRRERWLVCFSDGREIEGVPWVGSFVSFLNPTFMFKETDGKTYSVPFDMIVRAHQLG